MNTLRRMQESNHISFMEQMAKFESISLEELDSIKLMNRIDTKYITNESVLLEVLKDAAAAGYRALEVNDFRVSPYDSIYYDTDDLKMFQDHHNRRLIRQKVRTRSYESSGSTFLEIKRKNNKGRTKKKRTIIPSCDFSDFRQNSDAVDYLTRHSAFTVEQLSPVLETMFNRITLVNPAKTERLTIDVCIKFRNFKTKTDASLNNAVIIELKQDGRVPSQIKEILLKHRVKPSRISKYCIAITLTDPDARSNRFRPRIRNIEKIINQKLDTL